VNVQQKVDAARAERYDDGPASRTTQAAACKSGFGHLCVEHDRQSREKFEENWIDKP
jgi:hypothetical protein